jgi:glutaconyl-CoA/methylmalonyl-CoA decarboxylase subunit gamma
MNAETGEISIKSPMPGLIAAIPVVEGQAVKAGETVIILESMKMQNELKTPRDGVVARVSVQAQQSVEQGKVLVTIV